MEGKLKLALIASGSGTDANSIMEALPNIPEISGAILISTKEGAGCLDRAKVHGVQGFTLDREQLGRVEFIRRFEGLIVQAGVDFVFLVGCTWMIQPIAGVPSWNIHPAEKNNHGGRHMHGILPHKHVLQEILDRIFRGRARASDQFYTHPTIHVASPTFDEGVNLLEGTIPVPRKIVEDLHGELIDIDTAAKRLQDHVLPFEWLMLPAAVRMAARIILTERGEQ
jgi:phosphoribosylglycinamide formyltransferase-1